MSEEHIDETPVASKASEMESHSLLGPDRQRVIDDLFDELTTSSFAEGCEAQIARGLEARTDAQLIAFAIEKGT